MKTEISIFVLTLTLAALACNAPTEKLGAITPGVPQNSPPSLPTAGTTLSLTETDACKLFNEAQASAILGEAVIPPVPANATGYSVCTFFTSTMKKGIYISITMGDQAKKNLLNEISQYQKGCSVGYSGGTSTATPFPPEIEAMMSKSLLELLQMDIQMQTQCGGKIEPLPEFGANAYAYHGLGAFQIGTVAIVSGDNMYSFAYADPGLDIPQMVEKAKEVARAVISATPSGSPTLPSGPTPVSSPTLIGDPTLPPTPISSPTWVGPTIAPPVGPTWVGPTSPPVPAGKPTKVPKPNDVPTPVEGPTLAPTWVPTLAP